MNKTNNSKPTLVITGSSGFVGQSLAKAALNFGYDVIGLDIKINSLLEFKQHQIDLANEDFYNLVPKESVIIHLASMSTDLLCKNNPSGAIEVNLSATVRVVENANRINSRHLIFASSEWVYPERQEFCDQYESEVLDLANLKSIYAISKLTGESLIRCTSQIPFSILRFGIIYGPRKFPGSAVESIASKVFLGGSVEVGSSKTSRSFIFIDDLIAGILRVVEVGKEITGIGPMNISGSKLYSLGEIVEILNLHLNRNVEIKEAGASPSIRNPNITKAKETLGWEPKTNLIEGVQRCLIEMNILK